MTKEHKLQTEKQITSETCNLIFWLGHNCRLERQLQSPVKRCVSHGTDLTVKKDSIEGEMRDRKATLHLKWRGR